VSILEGDHLSQEGMNEASAKPIDLFITEFHHNILNDRHIYRPENVLHQVKSLMENKWVAENFTVLLDTTIGFQLSDEVREFLNDPAIKSSTAKGRLNVVLLRSAQKFDMLGMDNYYGGITLSINEAHSFVKFNHRMKHKDDQLKGLNYQGLTHIQKYSGPFLDMFRKALMDNTHKLFQNISKEAIYREGSQNPLQISKLEDDQLFFLDIKFPKYPKTAESFRKALLKFAKQRGLPFTTRASFGFLFTNLARIDGQKLRLCAGLEGENILNQYSTFINEVQRVIEEVLVEARDAHFSTAQTDQLLSVRIRG
jgi:hypothetical protein